MPKEKILVVSNTRMRQNSCVGGFVLTTGRPVRLMCEDGAYQGIEHPFEIGSIYDIDFNEPKEREAPHNENILVSKQDLLEIIDDNDITDYLVNKIGVNVWNGDPNALFDGKLNWTGSGRGYINDKDALSYSTGFWLSDKELKISGLYYRYPNGYNFKYIGYEDSVKIIPAGTLIRVSLARWWDTNGLTEDRCYLQLSGWYGI